MSVRRVPLAGSNLPVFDYLALFGKTIENGGLCESPADGSAPMKVCLVLRQRPDAERLPTLEEIAAVPFGQRRHLSHEEFAQRYGGSAGDVRAVRRFAWAHGLQVEEADAERRTCRLAGTVAQMADAFGVGIKRYCVGELSFLAYRECVSLPAALDGVVECVFGLDTFPVGRAQARGELSRRTLLRAATLAPVAAIAVSAGCASAAASDATAAAPAATPAATPAPSPSPSAGETAVPPQTRFPDPPEYFPPEVAKLYNFPAHLDGSGECIGIVALGGGYDTTVLQSYFDYLKIPMPSLSWVDAGAKNDYPNGDSEEIMLDIETAGTVAPGAKLVVYGGENYYEPLLKALTDTANNPSVISISFSEPETLMSAADKKALDDLITQAAAKGVTLLNASGDTGSSISSIAAMQTLGFVNNLALANYPGSSPGFLTVGGTTLFAKGERIVEEIVWNALGNLFAFAKAPPPAPPQAPSNNGATGGGVSIVYAQPSYQDKAQVPKATNHRAAWRAEIVQETLNSPVPIPDYGRGVPDVGGHASAYKFLTRGTAPKNLSPLGGTSATTPLWAALVARLNQGLKRRCGFLNPTLYQELRPGALRQITYGCNGAYQAHPTLRWNACTGLGVPDGTELLRQLQRLVPRN